ncbi:MAG: ASCH domain-containing protein [Ancalomicrobiaceae bacterium]|nr:ASCH domain-containing protein [Ancalomicrobiaceae bacterium]
MTDTQMLALSIRQPWAWAIFHAGKGIENRDWPTKVRGRVLIHTSKAKPTLQDIYFVEQMLERATSAAAIAAMFVLPAVSFNRGGIIGSVEIIDCVTESPSPWFFGRFGFVLKDPKPLPFIPCKGALGFWRVPDDILAQLEEVDG